MYVLFAGFDKEYNHETKKWTSEYYIGPIAINKSGAYLKIFGGEIGGIGVFGGNFYFNIGPGPNSSYSTPLLPADNTNFVNPYKPPYKPY